MYMYMNLILRNEMNYTMILDIVIYRAPVNCLLTLAGREVWLCTPVVTIYTWTVTAPTCCLSG